MSAGAVSAQSPTPSFSGSPEDEGSVQLRNARPVRGNILIIVLAVVVCGFLALNLWAARANQTAASNAKAAAAAMADRSKVNQVWVETTDGMRATFRAVDPENGARVASIRSYLRGQRVQHLRADYSDVRFEGRSLPGRPELEFGTENLKLNVRYRDVPGGGELRFIGTDSDRDIMKASLLEWSAAVQKG